MLLQNARNRNAIISSYAAALQQPSLLHTQLKSIRHENFLNEYIWGSQGQ